MSESGSASTSAARVDDHGEMDHLPRKPANDHEKEVDHRNQPQEACRNLLAAAARFTRGGGAFHSGSQQSDFPGAREAQLKTLSGEPLASAPAVPSSFVGGEHAVFIPPSPEKVFKQTLPGFYGRILDERTLLDSHTFLNRRKLAMRGALPSEYLQRWGVLADVFGLITEFRGRTETPVDEPCMVVSQFFIPENEDDPATLGDVGLLFEAHGFAPVAADIIVNPEIQNVTWYRERDGLLITDAHARNFRKDLAGYIIPIDLVVTIVPRDGFLTLPKPAAEWKPSYLL